MKAKGRFHIYPSGMGQITIPSSVADKIELKNKDKVMLLYDEKREILTITSM